MIATAPTPVLPDAVPVPPGLFGYGALPVDKATEFCGYARSKLYELMDAGQLPYSQDGPGGRRLIPRLALVELLAKNAVGATAVEHETTGNGVGGRTVGVGGFPRPVKHPGD